MTIFIMLPNSVLIPQYGSWTQWGNIQADIITIFGGGGGNNPGPGGGGIKSQKYKIPEDAVVY